MLNTIWLKQPYMFAPLYEEEVNTYLNASARVFDSAQQVCSAMASWAEVITRIVVARTQLLCCARR